MYRNHERLTALLLILLAGLLATCGGGSGPGTLQGQVVDAQGDGLPRLTVAVYGLQGAGEIGEGSLYQRGNLVQEQITGDDGAFSFSLEPGRYVVQVQQDGAVVSSRIVEIRSNRVESADFQLSGSSRGAVYMARMFSTGVSAWM